MEETILCHIVTMPGSLEKIKRLIRNSVIAEKVEASTSALGMTIFGAEFK